MTIQDRIEEALKAAKEARDGVRELGNQWQQANAHTRATLVVVGMMATGEALNVPLDPEQLQHLESAGTMAIIGHVGMPAYSGLVMHMLSISRMQDDDGDNEEEDDDE